MTTEMIETITDLIHRCMTLAAQIGHLYPLSSRPTVKAAIAVCALENLRAVLRTDESRNDRKD